MPRLASLWRMRLRALGSRTTSPIRRRLCGRVCISNLKGKKGLEIGGPSEIFKNNGALPIYRFVSSLDGCNFCKETVWEGKIKEGWNYRFLDERDAGYQYICDAVDLNPIKSASYDFVLSSHNIEHIANPLKAMTEWMRVLKDQGLMLLVIPNKNGTFDHNRPVTTLSHLIHDFERKVGEDDLSHLPEILELHDLKMDPAARDRTYFKERSLNNYRNRCLHHHVFDIQLAVDLVRYLNLEIKIFEFVPPFSIVLLVKYKRSQE